MIADLKPYPEYKDSGLPWLGQVPVHWEMKRLKNWVSINTRTLGESTSPDFEFDYLDIGSVTTGRLAKSPNRLFFVSAPSRARRVLKPGDTIVSTVRTYLKAVFTVGSVDRPLVASTGFAVLTPRSDTTARCLGYVAQSEAFTNQVTAESVGIAYPAISETRLGNIAVTLPPPSEQAAIVRFLDWANGRLERAIRAKRKQLVLMGERVMAETEQALRSDDIVTHRLSTIAQVMSRPIDRRGDQMYTRIGLYNRGRGIFVKPTVPGTDLGDSDFFTVLSGDFVISGQFAWEGAVALVRAKESGCIASHRYPILRGHDGMVSSAYLYAFFRTSYGAMLLDHHSRGAAGRNRPLNAQRLMKEKIPVPSSDAQERIEYLLEQEYAIKESVERMVQSINEYRTRLVADVVTGKLDVRTAAAALPDEAPLDVALEEDLDSPDADESLDEEEDL